MHSPYSARRLLAAVALTLVSAVAAQTQAQAQTYPTKQIRMLVPYSAGGGTDTIARLVAQGMSEQFGQTVIVENMAGAGGNLATQTVAAAAPDGYTILMANQGPMAVNPHLFTSLKVDPLKAFDPITMITAAPLVIVVPANSPYQNFQQLIEDAKKKPKQINYGSAGNGSASHLATVLMNVITKVDTTHVPYRGAGPALNDLIGGQTQFMVTTFPSVLGLLEGGRVRAIAVTTKERASNLPNVPTVAESGYPEYEASAWYGFVVPKGTPSAIVAALRKATVDAINGPQIKDRLVAEGAKPVGNEPAEFGAFIASESKRWGEIVKASALKLE
jgi:tripartite-type tricarboxylate transporter receptor subunit TctC